MKFEAIIIDLELHESLEHEVETSFFKEFSYPLSFVSLVFVNKTFSIRKLSDLGVALLRVFK